MALHISEILLSKKRLLAWLESFWTDEATSSESLKKLRRVLKQEKEINVSNFYSQIESSNFVVSERYLRKDNVHALDNVITKNSLNAIFVDTWQDDITKNIPKFQFARV